MGDKVGDAQLAQKVIALFEEGRDGSSWWEIENLGLPRNLATIVDEVLDTRFCHWWETEPCTAVVTDREKEILLHNRFSKEFVETLAGPDGRRVLEAQVKWFREKACFDGGKDLGSFLARTLKGDGEETKCAGDILDKWLAFSPNVPSSAIPQLRQFYYRFPDDDKLRLRAVSLVGRIENPGDDAILFLEEALSKEAHRPPYDVLNEVQKILFGLHERAIPSLIHLLEEGRSLAYLENVKKTGMTREFLLPLLEAVAKRMEYRGEVAINSWDYEWVLEAVSAIPESPQGLDEELTQLYREGGPARQWLSLALFSSFCKDPGRAEPLLIDALKSGERGILWQVFQILLDHFPLHRAMLVLAEGLSHPKPAVRKNAAAVAAMFREKAKDALPLLTAMRLNDPLETCRQAAVEAIANIEAEVL